MTEEVQRPRRVLIVSFFYPPFNSIGGLRVSKLSRYLLELGWDVRVLTADKDVLSADLPLELPPERVERARARDINALPRLVLGRARVRTHGFDARGPLRPLGAIGALYRDVTNFPDGQIGWYGPAVRSGRRLLSRWRPDVIFSSALPATAHLVGRRIANEHRIPWVAEYRDPWTGSRARRRRQPLYALERRLEDRVVRDAKAIVTVSDAWAAEFADRFPGVPVTVVPNGYDPADYEPGLTPPSTGPLTLLYTGRLYPRQDPLPLLRALRSLIDAGAVARDDIRIRFVGRYIDAARDAARSLGLLGDVVMVDEPIPHRATLAAQQQAHVLVLFLGDDDDIGWRPAKLYEYLGAHRPILMIGGSPHHEARAVLRSCGAGVASTDDGEIAALIRGWLAELRATGIVAYRGDQAAVDAFERRALTGRLDATLRSVLD